MLDIDNIHVDLDIVLSKKTTLKQLLNPVELASLKSKAIKNHYDDASIMEAAHRLIKENIADYLDNSDFLDANVILETDPYIIKAMELMQTSQRDAGILLVEKEYKYPGCWVNDIANALRELKCSSDMYNTLVWDAYYVHNYNNNENIPGWKNLQDVLEDYYDTL